MCYNLLSLSFNWIHIAFMQNHQLKLNALVESLDSNHAEDILVLDVRHRTSFTDTMVICSARSIRHLRSLADHVINEMRAHEMIASGQQGVSEGEWALIDFSDFIVNIMLPSARDFYNLEGLWQSANA